MRPLTILAGLFGPALALPSAQKVLGSLDHPDGSTIAEGSAPFTLREQGAELCDAGSRHWTGTVNVTAEKSIFYWYFESRDTPSEDPLLLWMSGGPGASGEFGSFLEIGPCIVNKDGNSTRRRASSWVDHANVVFVDQPSGVGFSQITERDLIPIDLHEGGQDIHTFLTTFTKSIFPDLAQRPLHITGESMGGHYVTGYTHHIISQERELQRQDTGHLPLNIVSAIIVDGFIDASYQSTGYYDFFCADWRGDGRKFPLMNATACEAMATVVPRCELLGAQCRTTYDGTLCAFASEWCDANVGKYYLQEVRPGGWNPYDSRTKCIQPPLCFDLDGGSTSSFFNRKWVQDSLGFDNITYQLIDFDVGERWVAGGQIFLPVTRELTWLLDQTDIGILFVNGNNDIVINTPGQIRLLDQQPWQGQAQYRDEKFHDWYYNHGEIVEDTENGGPETLRQKGASRGGTVKGSRRLKLVTVDEAGHMAPLDQPEAVGAMVWEWTQLHAGTTRSS